MIRLVVVGWLLVVWCSVLNFDGRHGQTEILRRLGFFFLRLSHDHGRAGGDLCGWMSFPPLNGAHVCWCHRIMFTLIDLHWASSGTAAAVIETESLQIFPPVVD